MQECDPGDTAGSTRKPLRSLIRRGAAWSTLDVAVNRTGGFLFGLVVARLLAPRDFGIYAVALVVHMILFNISDLGLGTALIRGTDDEVDAAAPTVATIAAVSGFVLGGLMALSAPTFARLLGAPAATATIQVMAITLPLAGVAAVPGALLRRNFRMDRLFVADTSNTVISGAVVVPLAIAGAGPLALALAFVAGQLVTTVLLLIYSPSRLRLGWNRGKARELLSFGMPLVAANILGFSIQNVDYIVIGRLLGPVPLGFYMLAFNISGWPLNVFSAVVRSVSLPAFARMREDGRDMAKEFCSALRMVARLTLPVCLFLGALAHPLIVTVYGHKWGAASHALIGLGILAAGRTLMELFADFLVSLGRTRAVLVVQIIWLIPLIGAMVLLVHSDGIAGAGAAHAIVATLIVIPTYVYFVAHAGVPTRLVGRALLPVLAWATLTAAIAYVVASRVGIPVLACGAGGAFGLAVYLLPYGPEIRGALAGKQLRRRRRAEGVPAIDPA